MANDEQVYMWECLLLTSRAVPTTATGPLRWVPSLDGNRLVGSYLPTWDPSETGSLPGLAAAGQYLDLGEANDLTTFVQGQAVDEALDEQLLIGIERKTLDQEPEREVAPARNPWTPDTERCFQQVVPGPRRMLVA
jgi:hypothetical protein